MLTKNEITALSLSPTKKDFVQIWNELLEVAGKLSERWDPTSTNESDPGIVILKALTGIADKLNYNIDKNTLEAFMPTAAQEDSMRKLCDMLGYNIKYYRSAETEVTIKYHNSDPSEDEELAMSGSSEDGPLVIPKFTVITNIDQDIKYFTTNPIDYYITSTTPTLTLSCMEGQIVKCESTADNNVITTAQISENNRFYLPEAQVAENGIFIYNVTTNGTELTDGTSWEKVDNLNIQARGTRVFKFGYDSYESRPYIEFPSDYSELINDGLFIYYARTSGANGNVSAKTLTQLELPSGGGWSKVSAESFSVENTFAATTGADIETIKQAYNSFKKTIGTFETLVTCRDYMNKIYSLTNNVGKPLVSNILVTDIRNDLNRAVTICSCDNAGIFYKELPLTHTVTKKFKGQTTDTNEVAEITVIDTEPAINHFDLVFYPFKSYSQIKNNVKDIRGAYNSSFNYSQDSFNKVTSALKAENAKTIAHNIITPRDHDIVSINNYLRLNAIIGTNSKITTEEGVLLIETIKIALANAFNMRELDFGEEIPFESIVEVIEKADPRIRVVSLNEPALYTTFSVLDGIDSAGNAVLREYAVASDWLTVEEAAASEQFDSTKNTFNTKEAKEIYNRLAVRNVLAGRVPLFKYNTTFKTDFTEGAYKTTNKISPSKKPDGLVRPNKEEPFTLYVAGDKTYTGQWSALTENPTALAVPFEVISDDTLYVGELIDSVPVYSQIIYTETAVPEQVYANNIIAKDPTTDDNFTEISTSCRLFSDSNNYISNVELTTGEFVKFRAPNFITTKTYPAYVNYHLQLRNSTQTQANPATAYTLYELLNGEAKQGTSKQGISRWNNVLSYFSDITNTNNQNYVETFTLEQKVSTVVINPDENDGGPELEIKNPAATSEKETPAQILAKSGCIKLGNSGRPTFKNTKNEPFTDSYGALAAALTIRLEGSDSEIITTAEVFNTIKETVNTTLYSWYAEDKLPAFDWVISYDFEYIPFEPKTLAAWETFVSKNSYSLFGFTAEREESTILWRTQGEGYQTGKYILNNASLSKLLPFTGSNFGTLVNSANLLNEAYVVQNLGNDQIANFIKNEEEYKLRANEYLYIEYTPSTTSEDGSTQTQEPVKEILGPGTIIRPTGFTGMGMQDSTAYALDHSSYKKVSFDGIEKNMFSFGANEQVELRESAQVQLNKDSFKDSSTIYLYKNFNNCPELEKAEYENGVRINNTYILKDGEYIFYTDATKAEFAYYASGTQITLTGKVVIPEMTILDLTTILDNGLQEIPWYSWTFSSNDSIVFQEYQYITLGPGDILKDLIIQEPGENVYLDEHWKYCSEVKYIPAGAAEPDTLPDINIDDSAKGCGWETCSILELNVSPSNAQTLRKTDKVETSLVLYKTSATNPVTEELVLKAEDSEHPLSFKTNLVCQSSNGKIKVSEIYPNPNNIKSLELKVFSESAPVILSTEPDTVVPYRGTGVYDLTTWAAGKPSIINNYNVLWSQVLLTELASSSVNFDNALKLAISLLPNTYGIFSIYIDYPSSNDSAITTWIELAPGMTKQSITLLNAEPEWQVTTKGYNKLMLNPGLNCVQVNTTGDIFIKTSSNAIGALYFDELRLVESVKLTYTRNGKEETQVTRGLNLDQLGYLDASDTNSTTFSIFDKRVRKKLKSDYTNEAITALENKQKTLTETLAVKWKDLVSAKPKLQTLVTYVETVLTELSAVTDIDSFNKLLQNYKTIHKNLSEELELKAILDNNKNIDELEKRLTNLLDSFIDIEASRQQLLTELEQLKDAAENNSNSLIKETLRKGDILDDFEAVADTALVKYQYLTDDIKYASIKEINARYGKQLDSLAKDIENALKVDEVLSAALSILYANKHKVLLEQVKPLVSTYHDSLDTLIDDIIAQANGTAAGTVDYTNLERLLNELKTQVSTTDLRLLMARIEAAAEGELYTDLAEAVKTLKTLLDVKDADNAIISAIDKVLELVAAKDEGDTLIDTSIVESLQDIQSNIEEYYVEKLKAILDNIDSVLTTISNTYDIAHTYLTEQEDEQVALILGRLEAITRSAVASIAVVDSFGMAEDFDIKTDYTSIPFGEEAVLTAWPIYMRNDFDTGVSEVYNSVRETIKDGRTSSHFVIPDQFYFAVDTLRPVLAKAANIEAFEKLFDTAKTLISQSTQNDARRELIESLSDLIPTSFGTISSIDDKNAVIGAIIASLQSTDVTIAEKQRLIGKLKEELDKVIYLDTQLAEINAELLCPSILLFENNSELQNDEFYTKLQTCITQVNKDLLSPTGSYNKLSDELTQTLSYNKDKLNSLLAILETDIEDDIATITGLNATLLANYYYSKIAEIQGIVSDHSLISEIQNSKLFELLNKEDLIAAWESSHDNWIDSAGNSLICSAGVWLNSAGEIIRVDVKRTIDGEWQYADGTQINIGIEIINEDSFKVGSKTAQDKGFRDLLDKLIANTSALGQTVIPSYLQDAYATVLIEEQLLNEIRNIDIDRSFYYNVPVETHIAIDFNESDSKLNTLMNPAVNYDINNINNNFVISKLDINYLTKGLQIARSSRLS